MDPKREDRSKSQGPSERARMNQALGKTLTIGLEIVLAILLGFGAGHYLDLYLGTKPYLTIFMTLSGVGAAIKAMIRITKEYKAQVSAQKDEEK